MDPILTDIVEQYTVQVQELMSLLESGRITAVVWRTRMGDLLARYHMAAMMSGSGEAVIPPGGILILSERLRSQFGYLDNFATEVAAAEVFKAAWRARANLYVNSSRASFWDGYIYSKAGRFLPIVSVPGDGTTQCLTQDCCELRVVKLGENDFDVYWVLDDSIPYDQHCQTCVERSIQWNPLKIRDNVLEI